MKAIICSEPEQFEMVDVPMPIRGPGEALVKIRTVGICGTDIHAFYGNQPYFTYPRVLGHELAGTVEEVDAANDRQLHPGDQVSVIPYLHCGKCIACRTGKTNCCTQMQVIGVHRDGGMAEYVSVPVTHLITTNGLSLSESAILEPLSIGAHAVRRANVQPGEFALVIGAGPIGLGVMAFARRRGARVIVMDIQEARLEFCRQWCHLEGTINALNQPNEAIAKITDGDYPTVVFDATGNRESMIQSLYYVAHGGRLVYVGLHKGDIAFSDPEFHKRELTVIGSRNATTDDFDVVLEAVRRGHIQTDSYITHRVAFEEMIGEFESITKPEANMIKAVIEL